MTETKVGGLILLSGALLLLITIFFEYKIGWIGIERPETAIPHFIYDNWTELGKIWSWQTLAHVLFTISYILLLKNSKGIMSLLWSFMLLFGIMMVISLGITVGSYYPALEVYNEQPQLFNTIRGAIKTLYFPAQLGSMLLLVIFLIELFSKEGVVNKKLGFITIGLVLIAFLLALITSIQIKVIGAVWFIIPVILGYSYWKNIN